MKKAKPVKWTREHLLVALNLYCKLPFGQLRHGNPVVIEVANKLGRTPDSLSMKLCNLASLDPVLQARGIKGLKGASQQDRDMWHEFQAHTGTLAPESEELLHDLFTKNPDQELDFLQGDKIQMEIVSKRTAPAGPTEVKSTVLVRRGQQFFRQSILNAYGIQCCITGISIPRLLVASHIKPWRDFPDERLNPRNGLCLSSLHDAAFDGGLITLDENLHIVLSRHLRKYFPQPALEQNFATYEGQRINRPAQLAEPDAGFLKFHREHVFKK